MPLHRHWPESGWIIDMIIRRAIEKESLDRILTLYKTAFPECEQKPFQLLVKKQLEGTVDILYLEEEGSFAGLAIMARERDLVLLDYFAIDDSMRNKGIGSRVLAALKDHYHDMRMIIEIESTEIECEDHEMRARRKEFYHRANMTDLPFTVSCFGTEMETLSNGTDISFDEYRNVYVQVYGADIAANIVLLKSGTKEIEGTEDNNESKN